MVKVGPTGSCRTRSGAAACPTLASLACVLPRSADVPEPVDPQRRCSWAFRPPASAPPRQPHGACHRQRHGMHRAQHFSTSPGVAAVRPTLQTPANHPSNIIGQRRNQRLLMHDPMHHRAQRPTPERPLPARREHQHPTEREQIRRRPDRPAGDLLGRQVARRTDDDPGGGQVHVLERPRDAEVDHPRPVVGEQDVRRLEIAVHHPGAMDRDQRLGQPRGDVPQTVRPQRPLPVYGLLQRRPRQVLRREPRPRGIRIGIDHGGRERPADLPNRLDLAPEPRPEAGIVGELGPDHLQRDEPPARRPRQVNGPHRTAAQPRLDHERTDDRRVLVLHSRLLGLTGDSRYPTGGIFGGLRTLR